MKKLIKFLDAKTYFLFTIIPVCLYSFFYVLSVITGIGFSLTDWNGINIEYNFIGLQNYTTLLSSPILWRSMAVTLHYAVVLVIGVVSIALLLALSLNSIKRFKTFLKSVFFVPAMIGAITIALIWDQLFYRLIPVIGETLGIEALKFNLLASPDTALYAVLFVHLWQAVSMPTIIFLAGLQSIPEDVYESARMDGASILKCFRHITLPFLLPTITVNTILTVKMGFTSFDYAFALTGGGPVRSTQLIGILIYGDAFGNMRFASANAEAMILFVIIATFSIIQIKFTNKKEDWR